MRLTDPVHPGNGIAPNQGIDETRAGPESGPDRGIPFNAEPGIVLLRIRTDRGTECCGKAENRACTLYLGLHALPGR